MTGWNLPTYTCCLRAVSFGKQFTKFEFTILYTDTDHKKLHVAVCDAETFSIYECKKISWSGLRIKHGRTDRQHIFYANFSDVL